MIAWNEKLSIVNGQLPMVNETGHSQLSLFLFVQQGIKKEASF
jgi:hypothetical protein